MTPRDRITAVAEKWFLAEPLLFAVWTTHELAANPRIQTIRVGQGRVEYNPAFLDALGRRELEQVLALEAMRILLKHPYARRPTNAELAYAASNLTLQECLETSLPLPRARDVFRTAEFDQQFYEFYYQKLLEQQESADSDTSRQGWSRGSPGLRLADGSANQAHSDTPSPGGVDDYVDAQATGAENAAGWEPDELRGEQINDRIRAAAETDAWGSVPGRWRQRLLASLRPKLDYRAVLRQFRASVLSVRRRLTRMKPNRRYGFDYLGSRYDFTTRLLFAVDVSGSMSDRDLSLGFSAVNRFFKYGVEAVDVIQFDTEVKGEPVPMRRAGRSVAVEGRGGTSFAPVMEFLDANREYDGAIVYTDGYAPVPERPKNRRTRVLWLFKGEEAYESQHRGLRAIGRSAFLREARA